MQSFKRYFYIKSKDCTRYGYCSKINEALINSYKILIEPIDVHNKALRTVQMLRHTDFARQPQG